MADAQLQDVNKYFGNTQVLQDINLNIEHGEFITFVGPSGSGKSTLLRIIAGPEAVTSGKVFIGGREVTDKPPKARNISMVFQNYALYPHMTVAKNITFGMRIRHEKKTEQKKALARVAAMLGLEGLLDRKPKQLSGGQRQRVAMARAIVHTPDLFLMDEPLSNLDAKLRNDVRLAIMDLQEQLDCTMVYVTHDQIEAMTMADRIVVLESGKIRQIGPPQELYHQPNNLFTAGFIGTPAMNFLPLVHDGGTVSFSFPEGNSSSIPLLPEELTQLIAAKKSIILGIRPEHIFDSKESYRAAKANDDGEPVKLTRTIHSSEMLGSEFLIHTDKHSGGIRYRRANNGTLPLRGEKVTLYFSPAHAHLFDAASGNRLN